MTEPSFLINTRFQARGPRIRKPCLLAGSPVRDGPPREGPDCSSASESCIHPDRLIAHRDVCLRVGLLSSSASLLSDHGICPTTINLRSDKRRVSACQERSHVSPAGLPWCTLSRLGPYLNIVATRFSSRNPMASALNKRQQARNERTLQELIKSVPGNGVCADCSARNPGEWPP